MCKIKDISALKIRYLFIFLIFFVAPLDAQKIKFDRIDIDYGLSLTFAILQDNHGFIWFGAEDGLYRYDGYRFKRYQYHPDSSNTLSSNKVNALCLDKSGNLWIGTEGGGLNRLNLQSNVITRYKNDSMDPHSLSSNVVRALHLSADSCLWVGTENGLNKYDPETDKFRRFVPPSDANQQGGSFKFLCLTPGQSGVLWIGSRIRGFYKFDLSKQQFVKTIKNNDMLNALNGLRVNSILEEEQTGLLWIGTNKGLKTFDIKAAKFTSDLQHIEANSVLEKIYIHKIIRDRSGNLWFGADQSGLYQIEPKRKEIKSYIYDADYPENPERPAASNLITLFEDSSGVIWIGFWGGATVNKFDPLAKKFDHYHRQKDNPNSLAGNQIRGLLEDNEGIVWITSETGGLTCYDPKNNRFSHFKNDFAGHNGSGILKVSQQTPDIMWFGSWGGGLVRYNKRNGESRTYTYDVNDPYSISDNIVGYVYCDTDGSLWVCTTYGGLNKLDPQTGKAKHYKYDPDNPFSIGNDFAHHIVADGDSILWIATVGGGLNKFDKQTERFTCYMNNPLDPQSISSNSVFWICRSSENDGKILWLATRKGLNKFDVEKEHFTRYDQNDGLPGEMVLAILEDNHGHLWLSTGTGLSSFNPKTEEFKNYDKSDLGGNDFNGGSCLKASDGRLYFGAAHGLIAFYPDSIKDNKNIPAVVLTDFQIFNKPIYPGKKSPLKKLISETREIRLSYDQSVFSFEFAALDFHNPSKNKYAYQMEGIDPDWVYTDASRRFATYTNLDPGEYIFKVKGSNNDGIWNEAGTSLRVIILPPWWATNIAYFLYILFLLTALITAAWLYRHRLNTLHRMELNRLSLQKMQEVDHLKSHFFANISHEFRTPLTLIKGPVKQMLQGEFMGNVKEQYRMILRNSDRLLNLINQILDLSKLESGKMKLEVVQTDLIPLLKGIVQSFESLARSRVVKLVFKSTEQNLEGYTDPDKLEKIISNLLSNAFKFTPEGGKVVVTIKSVIPAKAGIQSMTNWIPDRVRNDKIEKGMFISIHNSGPSIPQEQLDHIFDRFYQTGNNYKNDSQGTGIGLALVKELVQAHHGQINVESTLEKGTTFRIWLPVERENFKPDEIIEETEKAKRKTQNGETSIESLHKLESREFYKDSQSRLPSSLFPSPSVLIVEDNADVSQYISSFLADAYQIHNAENGRKGVSMALDINPDLIISDVMMPEMDGFELCEKVKSDQRISHIPLILLTAKADLDSRLQGLEYGADAYLAKPFEAEELSIRVRKLIEQRRELREHFLRDLHINPHKMATGKTDLSFAQKAVALVEKHLDDENFSIEAFAEQMAMSRQHLNRKLQALTGLSALHFLNNIRIKYAARLLQDNNKTVSEVAYKVGFNNLSHFSKCFRDTFGVPPSKFKRHISSE